MIDIGLFDKVAKDIFGIATNTKFIVHIYDLNRLVDTKEISLIELNQILINNNDISLIEIHKRLLLHDEQKDE